MQSPLYSRHDAILLPYYPRLVYLSLLELGCQEDELFDGLDLSAAQLQNEKFRLSIAQHEQFILRALEVSGDPHLAIRLSKVQDASKANLALMAVANSGNISKALHMIMRYNRIFTRVFSIRSLDTDGHPVMEVESHLENDRVTYFAMMAFVLFLDRFFVEVLAGAHLVMRVALRIPEPDGFSDVVGKIPFPLSFGADRNLVYFDANYLDQPLRQADPLTVRLLIEMSDRQLEEAQAEMSLEGAVRSVVIDRLASPPKLDEVAKMLGISSRGLRRKLAHAGTSYKRVLDAVRMKMAVKLLRESDAPIASIAYELGFGSASDFGRAFKRCNGVAPSAVRQEGR